MAQQLGVGNGQQFLGGFFFFLLSFVTQVFVFPPFLNATAHDFAAWFSHLFASTHQPGEVLRRYEYQ